MADVPAINYEALFELNPSFSTPEFAAHVRDILAGNAPESTPFPHVCLSDFLVKPEALDILRAELEIAPWQTKINDLYSFTRTGEIDKFNDPKYPALEAFAKFIKTTFRTFLMELTGCELTDKVSIAGSRYDQTDVLLAHDDRMEERKFAFIFYLSPEWDASYGGDLNLFDCDERFEPTTVAKSITPKPNNFLFFDIRPESWHSVGEVVEPGKSRLSLNGWFHCEVANINRNPAPRPALNKLKPHEQSSIEDVQLWINPRWRNDADILRIKKIFAKKSEIDIHNFVPHGTYKQALKELRETARFNRVGPPNVIGAEQLDESALPEDSVLKKLFVLARSDALTLLISQWTGLDLFDMDSLRVNPEDESDNDDEPPVPDGDDNDDSPPTKKTKVDQQPTTSQASETTQNPQAKEKSASPEKNFDNIRVVTFLNKYSHGSYSLSDDRMAADSKASGYCFDLLLFFMEKPEWNEDAGGFYSYIAANDSDEVFRIVPERNMVAMLFREPEVINFTKYVNCLAGDDTFYVFQATYFGFFNHDTQSEPIDDLSVGYQENDRKHTYRTGYSSSDEDEDGDITNEPPPLIEAHVQLEESPEPEPEEEEFLGDSDSAMSGDPDDDEEEEEEEGDVANENNLPSPGAPQDAQVPSPQADPAENEDSSSSSSDSSSSVSSGSSSPDSDVPPHGPLVDGSSTDSNDIIGHAPGVYHAPPLPHLNPGHDFFIGAGLEPEVSDSDPDDVENYPPF